ncbi:MAG: hypothetical protein ABS75_32260 [Pelagibacterium sp. SCN 63-23]|nr:MAG: hypothetical protein ABS75_32260 [Pelagibacterium sp. SCN 63-23]
MSHSSLGNILDARNNSFNAVRLMAALAVFVSHAFLIAPAGGHWEPLDGSAYNLGQISVNIFFFLSGMMLSRSYALKPNLGQFVVARLLRIFPGLVVCGVVTAWVIGALNTALSPVAYFSDVQTLTYPLRILLQFNNAELPGVFAYGLEPGEVNVPLWTVKFELLAYGAMLFVPLLGLFGSKWFSLVLTVGFGAMLMVSTATQVFDTNVIGSIVRFGFSFSLGMSAFLYRDQIKANWVLAIAGIVVTMFSPPWAGAHVFSILAFAYLAITIGGTTLPVLTGATSRNDVSYGLYLYAFPIQQALIAQFGHTIETSLLFSVLALLVSMVAAYASWIFVEKPALSMKGAFAARTRMAEGSVSG